ncbi:MAG: TetR-like C-terminal domain-containing protein [Eubacteriales bacterium]|nr:TetR-like C-terminal domain-containing protein [Eubacteriales bacterium]
MADALLVLMKKKDFNKITIDEIVTLAGVNRSTWFRNFKTKSDALTFKLVMMWNKWADDNDLQDRNRYTGTKIESFFAFCLSVRDIIDSVYEAGQKNCIYDAYYEVMASFTGNNQAELYFARFCCFGLVGVLDGWRERDFAETPEELAAIINNGGRPMA